MNKIFLTALCFVAVIFNSFSQEKPEAFKSSPVTATYSDKGLELKSASGNFSSSVGIRFQFRFFTPYDADPRSIEGFTTDVRPTFYIRRARLKIKGHAWRDYLKYNFEYDFPTSTLLNAFMKVEKWKGFNVMIGQYKAPFNRERVISSAEETMIERSIVNRAFTIDRQLGSTFYGNFGAESVANFSYWASVYTGVGILGTVNDDDNMMYAGRFQWNFAGSPIDIGESDSKVSENDGLRGAIAFAAATNISPYTRFSSSGGGFLDPFEEFLRGEPGQYKVDQWAEDLVLKYKGLTLLQELHIKTVDDRVNDLIIDMRGIFGQVGFYPGYFFDGVTKKLQFAFRYAYDDENTSDNVTTYRDEWTFGVNYYLNGFRNRLQTDFSLTNLHLPDQTINASRFRIQWDITF